MPDRHPRQLFIVWPWSSTAREIGPPAGTMCCGPYRWPLSELKRHKDVLLGVTRPPGGLPRRLRTAQAHCDFASGRTGIRSLLLIDPTIVDYDTIRTIISGSDRQLKTIAAAQAL
jgi:hypothetical protein